jgi:hypothetical protein
MRKDITVDGLNKTTYMKDDMEGKIAVKEEVNIDLSVWANEYNGSNNWFGLPPEVQKKILKKKLNSTEFRYFKTAEGNI